MALDLGDIAMALIPAGDGAALDVIRRQIKECGSEHIAFLERKRSQAHVLYKQPPRDASILTAPVIFLRYTPCRYVFGSSMNSGDSNIILPFDFVSPKQFMISLDAQALKASVCFCNGKTLLDGKAFPEGATADLKGGERIEIEEIVCRVMTIRASTTEPIPGPTKDTREEQRLLELKGKPMVNDRTISDPHKDAIVNALPSQNLQQDIVSIAQRPSIKKPATHAETMAFLGSISRQPVYSPVKPIIPKPQMRLSSRTDGGSCTVLEGLPKLEDYRRGAFVGKGSYGQVFRHESRHSIFAVKVVAFPKITPAGRGDINEKTKSSFDYKMASINREADLMQTVEHQFVLRAHQVFRYPEGLALVMPYLEDGELGSLAEYPPSGKTWPLPLSDARSISGQILSGIEYIHGMGYVHRDLKPANILLRKLDPLEVVICDYGFAQKSSKAKTRGGSRIWSAPECLWLDDESVYGVSVDTYSIGVILLWLLHVYAEDAEYTNERVYDELFGDKIRRAIDASENSEETAALNIGQQMAAYIPAKRPEINDCWEAVFFRSWKPPPVKDALDHTTALESKKLGRK